ncbi:Farnesyl pyrophosphate synthase, partial [Orchesella cincta]
SIYCSDFLQYLNTTNTKLVHLYSTDFFRRCRNESNMLRNFTGMLRIAKECSSKRWYSYFTPIPVSNNTSFKTNSSPQVGISIVPKPPTVTPVRYWSQEMTQFGRNTMERPQFLTEEEHKDFMRVYLSIVEDLLEIPEMEDMKETNQWMESVLHYNVTPGKQIRGQLTAISYKYFAKRNPKKKNIHLSYILGWCAEILNACLVVADDIMDESETRRGRPCWYKVDNLGLAAINDAFLLKTIIYQVLQKNFKDESYFPKVTSMIFDVVYKTLCGQSLDTRTSLERKMEMYNASTLFASYIKYKTSLYTYYLPIALAMTMAEINDPTLFQEVQNMALGMGHFFQVRDDFLDCFGDVEMTGKIGTDIENCKCSWLFVTAMQSCSPEQKKLLMENYGQREPQKVSVVKNLYNELRLEDAYCRFEEQTYNQIGAQIQQMSNELPKSLFFKMLHTIYKRSK